MNQVGNVITRAIVLAVFMGMALYVTLDIMLAEGRSLGRLYLYLAIAAFLYGALSARSAFFVCLITTGYIDFFKRLMAAFGNPSPEDLYYILGIPPLLIGGAVINLLIQFLIGKRRFRSIHFWSFTACSGLLGLSLLQATSGGNYRSLGDAVNQGAYAYLFFLLPELLPDVEDRRKIFRWMIPIFIGVALYMLRHHYLGLADFEHRYLMSGLSIESRILYENNGALRGFSTMAGAGVVAVFCSIMMLIVLIPMRKDGRRPGFGGWMLRFFLCGFFAFAAWTTVSRGGWVCGIAAFAAYFFLKTRRRAVIGYTCAGTLFAVMLALAPAMQKYQTLEWIGVRLEKFVGAGSDEYTKRAIVMGTMSARIDGWVNLTTNPDVWTPFGLRWAGVRFDPSTDTILYGHDFIIEFLVKYGYIPLFIVVCVGLFLLYRFNKVLFNETPGTPGRQLCRVSLAVAGGIFVGGFGNGAQLWVYPQNFYFYLSLAIVYTTYVNAWKARRIPHTVPVNAAPQPSAALPGAAT